MKNLFLIYVSLSFFLTTRLVAQETQLSLKQDIFPKNTFFVELAGNAGFSLNYDRIFYEKGRFKFSYRVGLGFLPLFQTHREITPSKVFPIFLPESSTTVFDTAYNETASTVVHWDKPQIAVPLELNVLYGKNKHFLELGVGYTLASVSQATFGKNTHPMTAHQILGYERKYIDMFCFRLNYRRQFKQGLFLKLGLMLYSGGNYQKTSVVIDAGQSINYNSWGYFIGIGVGKSF